MRGRDGAGETLPERVGLDDLDAQRLRRHDDGARAGGGVDIRRSQRGVATKKLVERSLQESELESTVQLDRGRANMADSGLQLLEQPDALFGR